MENQMPGSKTYDMDSSIENIFITFIKQQEISEGIDFLSAIDQAYIPSSNVIRIIIFDILSKCDDIIALSESKAYLLNLLEVYPPYDDAHRKYYLNGLCDSRGVLSELWPMFSHIVRSCLCHYKVYIRKDDDGGPQLIPFPNCNFLLDLYVKVLIKDFEYFSSERVIYAIFKKILLSHLLWPNSAIGESKNNSNLLLKWLNDIYKSHDVQAKYVVLDALHEVLCLMIRCIIRKHSLSDMEAINSTYLVEIVDDIMNFCKDAFSTLQNFNMFVTSLSLKYVQARVCEKIIVKLCSRSKTLTTLTLKNIFDYMLPREPKKKHPKNANILSCEPKKKYLKNASMKSSFSKGTNRQKLLLKNALKISKGNKGDTKLHELCRDNKFGDLATCLKSEDNVNVQNAAGHTPLHEACLSRSHYCVKVLIGESGKEGRAPVDLMASNKEGFTPLHYAVLMDDVAITKTLLINGGAQLLKLTNHKGLRPQDLAGSSEMTKVLEEFQHNSISDAVTKEDTKEDIPLEAPALHSYKDYSVYFHALNCLLCCYCNIFHIYTYLSKGEPMPADHERKECHHFMKMNNECKKEFAPCSEDVEMIQEVPTLIKTFITSVSKRASELDVTLDMELIPIRTFAASLTKHSNEQFL